MVDISVNTNTVVGIVIGGLVAMIGFLIRKWTGSLETAIKAVDEKKQDLKVCETTHRALCVKFDDFKDVLDEVRGDVKELAKSMNLVAKRGE
jgi:intracellular sulfur oxidation DsrE/DsrF family protein